MTQEFAPTPQPSQGGEPPASPDSPAGAPQTAIGQPDVPQQPSTPPADAAQPSEDAAPEEAQAESPERDETVNLDEFEEFRKWKSKMDKRQAALEAQLDEQRRLAEERQRKLQEYEQQQRELEFRQKLEQTRDPREREKLWQQRVEEERQAREEYAARQQDMQHLRGHLDKAQDVFQQLGAPPEVQQQIAATVERIAVERGPYAAYEALNDIKDDVYTRFNARTQQQPQRQQQAGQQQPAQPQQQQQQEPAQPVAAPSATSSGPMTYKQRKQQAFRNPDDNDAWQQYQRSLGIR